jgi:hypothetical protein
LHYSTGRTQIAALAEHVSAARVILHYANTEKEKTPLPLSVVQNHSLRRASSAGAKVRFAVP